MSDRELKWLISKADEPALQIVWAEVYAPDIPDSDGEFMSAVEIRKMAHDFIRSGRMREIDVQHDGKRIDASVVESFIARKGDPDFIEGSWVAGIHVADPSYWDKVLKKEINGFSMEAWVERETMEVEVEIPPVCRGITMKEEDHTHQFFVNYDENGRFRGGTTDEVNGHTHVILAGTVTEEAAGHVHRFDHLYDQVRITS